MGQESGSAITPPSESLGLAEVYMGSVRPAARRGLQVGMGQGVKCREGLNGLVVSPE